MSVCQGDTITLAAADFLGALQWQESSDSIIWHDFPGATYQPFKAVSQVTTYYREKVVNEAGISKISFYKKVIVNPVYNAGISILAAPSGAICKGDNLTFTALPVNGGVNPTYQWNLNGKKVGANNSIYTNNNINNGDKVSCEMVSTATCVKGSPVQSGLIAAVVASKPTQANAGKDQNLCNVTSSTLDGNVPTAGTGLWTVVSGKATITNPTSANSDVTDLVVGASVTLRWTISNAPCSASADDIIISVTALPTVADAGRDQNLCNVSNSTLTGNVPVTGTGVWSVISGKATITNPTSANSGVTDLVVGASATLRWTISNAPCSISADDIVISVSALPTIADAGADQNLCNVTRTVLAGNKPETGNGLWTVVSGKATITTPASATSGITDLIAGTSVTLRWTISNSPCNITSDDVIVSVISLPTVANAGADQHLCNVNSATLAGNIPTNGEGFWSVVSGNATISKPTSPTSDITDLVIGSSVTLRWTISNSPCAASFDDVIINVKELPTASNAGADQVICESTSTKLEGNLPTTGKGLWSVVTDTTSVTTSSPVTIGKEGRQKDGVTIALPTSPTSSVTGLKAGVPVILKWTISNAPCTTVDYVVIKVVKKPTKASAGSDQILCNETTTTLEGNNPSIGTGTWSVISGDANIVTPNSPTSLVTGLLVGKIAVLRWTISNSPCNATTDDVILTVTSPPTTAEALADIGSECGINTATVTGNTPIVGIGSWSVVTGKAIIATPDEHISEVTELNFPGKTVLRWTITNSPCPLSTADVVITTHTCDPGVCGSQIFTSSNLDVGTQINSTTGGQLQTNNKIPEKYCYNNVAANCSTYGGLYEWGEAMNYAASTNCDPCGGGGKRGLCPEGFHIPTDLEWSRYEWCTETNIEPKGNTSLATFQTTSSWRGTNSEAGPGSKMKAKDSNDHAWDGTNTSSFNAMPAGHRDSVYGLFSGLSSFSFYWSATEKGSMSAWYRDLQTGKWQSERSYNNKTNGFSVRCLKN